MLTDKILMGRDLTKLSLLSFPEMEGRATAEGAPSLALHNSVGSSSLPRMRDAVMSDIHEEDNMERGAYRQSRSGT